MKRSARVFVSLAVVCSIPSQASAFTSKQKATIPVTASGIVTESTTFNVAVVQQGSAADASGTVDFGSGGNTFRDSNAALKVTVDTNVPGNRVIIYTDNLGGAANPKFCANTSLGVDGGGLVGVSDCSSAVSLLWVVKDNNTDHLFTESTVGDDEVFMTDLAHVATFTQKGSALDNQPMARCAGGAAVTNTPNDGLYPQYFGAPGQNLDLCTPGTSTVVSQELSKNIAVVAFNFAGPNGNAANLSTPDPSDTISVASPIYLPIGADFRTAGAQNYSTNTLTLELITQ